MTSVLGNNNTGRDSIAVFWNNNVADSTIKFVANTYLYGREIPGILFLRKESTMHYKATFLAKGAAKLFDIEILRDTFFVRDHIPQLKKAVVLQTLAKDMKLLTLATHQSYNFIRSTVDSTTTSQTIPYEKGTLVYVRNKKRELTEVMHKNGDGISQVSLSYTHYTNGFPEKIILKHHRFRMQIHLTLLKD